MLSDKQINNQTEFILIEKGETICDENIVAGTMNN